MSLSLFPIVHHWKWWLHKLAMSDSSVIFMTQWIWKTAFWFAILSVMAVSCSLILSNDYEILHIHCGFRWLPILLCAKATVSDHRQTLELSWHWLGMFGQKLTLYYLLCTMVYRHIFRQYFAFICMYSTTVLRSFPWERIKSLTTVLFESFLFVCVSIVSWLCSARCTVVAYVNMFLFAQTCPPFWW